MFHAGENKIWKWENILLAIKCRKRSRRTLGRFFCIRSVTFLTECGRRKNSSGRQTDFLQIFQYKKNNLPKMNESIFGTCAANDLRPVTPESRLDKSEKYLVSHALSTYNTVFMYMRSF